MSRCTEHESIWKPRKREDPLKLEHCLKRFVERWVSHAIQHGRDFIIQLFVTTQFLYIVLRDFTWHYSGASARAPSRACCRKRKPIPMRENLVMPSAYTRPPRTHRQGGTSRFWRGRTVNPRLGETLIFSPRGSQWSFYRKDIEFFLFDLLRKIWF